MSVLLSHYAQVSSDADKENNALMSTVELLQDELAPDQVACLLSLAIEASTTNLQCLQYKKNVLLREIAHKNLRALRNVVARCVRVVQTLRQLSASFDLVATSAPPGQLFAPCVLATCCASNAPGLSPIAMNYWQVRLKE